MNQLESPPHETAAPNGDATAAFRAAVLEARTAVGKAYALAKSAGDAARLERGLILERLEYAYDSLGSLDRDWHDDSTPTPLDPALQDWKWVHDNIQSFHPSYREKHIAVFEQQVLDSGPDPMALRQAVARQYGIDPERIVITYID